MPVTMGKNITYLSAETVAQKVDILKSRRAVKMSPSVATFGMFSNNLPGLPEIAQHQSELFFSAGASLVMLLLGREK